LTRVCCGQPFPLCALPFSHELLKDLLRFFKGYFCLMAPKVAMLDLLNSLARKAAVGQSYLAGRTALVLVLGHRE